MSQPERSTSPPGGSPWTRGDRIALGVLAAVVLGSLPFLVHPWFDPMPDASMYLVTARSLLAGEGYSMLGEPFHVRPPGMAVLFAGLLATFGQDFQVLNTVIASFGALLVLCLFVLYRPSLGGTVAAAVGLVLWFSPPFRMFSNQLLSDVPGAALLFVALVVDRWVRRGGAGRDVLLGLSLAAATYVRTMAVLALPAIVLARWLERRRDGGEAGRPARLALFAAVALACLAPWQVRQARIEPAIPAEQTMVYSYSTGMFREDVGDPNSRRLTALEILDRSVRRRFTQLAGTAGHRLDSLEFDPGAMAWSALFLVALAWRLVRRREATELFALGSMAVLSVYFGYQERLFLPVYAVLLPAGADLVRTLAAARVGPRAASGLVAAGLAALLLFDLDLRRDWGGIKKRHNDFVELAAEVNRAFGPEVTLATGSGFHYQVYLDRPVWSLSLVERRDGRQAVEELMAEKGIDVVLLWRRFKQDRELTNWLPEGREAIEIGPAVAVRVR